MQFQRGYTQCNTNRLVPPSLTTFKGQLHCFYQQEGSIRLMHARSSNGFYWDPATAAAMTDVTTGNKIQTSAGPCSVVYQDRLYVFFRADRGDGVYYVTSSDGVTWSAPVDMKRRARSHLSVAAHDESLVLTYVNFEGDAVMYSKLSAGAWVHGNTGHSTSANRPGIAAFDGRFHIFYKDGHGKTGVMHISSRDAKDWVGGEFFHVAGNAETSASPTPVAYNGQLHLFYRDNGGNAVYHVFSRDGYRFEYAKPLNIGLDIDEGPAAAALGDMLCVIGVDADGKGIMRALHFPSIESALKGWDCVAAVDLGALPLESAFSTQQEAALTDASRDDALGVHLDSGVVAAAGHVGTSGFAVSFPLKAQADGVVSTQTNADAKAADARVVVTPSVKLVPSPEQDGQWDLMLDFSRLTAPPRVEGVHRAADADAAARLGETLASRIASQPAQRLGSFSAPFPDGTQFPYIETIVVPDSARPKGILVVLLSTQGGAPQPHRHDFDSSVLPAGSDAALYVSNGITIHVVGDVVQSRLREEMGPQGRDGTRPLTYGYKVTSDVPHQERLRAFTDGQYCRFWKRDYTPAVDWSWVDIVHSRLTVDLRVVADVRIPVTTRSLTSYVYAEAIPSLAMQIGQNRSQIVFQLETPVPTNHEVHGGLGKCVDGRAADAARDLAQELGKILSKIQPIGIGDLGQFTQASINALGELCIAAVRKA
ncbi:hypothetical protein LFL96_02225 [Paraburkholderia sp. D15]|uniref:hypothetical protein n=1 Tax=Paraburkholderia sp. D15 TaxID=2880218 RepID=UPI002479A5BF|nr:hypothetical protein [Paraburkholderia sp. D15]WGS50346.1 hypothetical protein LFL96_02225 [Paraburkholderia sp. D15]